MPKVSRAYRRQFPLKSSHSTTVSSQLSAGNGSSRSANSGRRRRRSMSASTVTNQRRKSSQPLTGSQKSRSKSATVTARTRTSQDSSSSHCIACLAESRPGAQEMGIAVFDLMSSECFVWQLVDSQTFPRTIQTLLCKNPFEIILPSSNGGGNGWRNNNSNNSGDEIGPAGGRLVSLLAELMPDLAVVSVSRSDYDDSLGLATLRKLALKQDMPIVESCLEGKYYALAAVNALFSNLETEHDCTFYGNTLKFHVASGEGAMLLDHDTVIGLELVRNTNDYTGRNTLLSTVNNTRTRMGYRHLKTNILQPSTSLVTINDRYDAGEVICSDEKQYFALMNAIKNLPDVDNMIMNLVRCTAATAGNHAMKNSQYELKQIEMLLSTCSNLQSLVAKLTPLHDILKQTVTDGSSVLLDSVKNAVDPDLEEFIIIAEILKESITSDDYVKSSTSSKALNLRNNRLFAIKSAPDGLLEIARESYNEATEDVQQLVGDLTARYDMNLRSSYQPATNSYVLCSSEPFPEHIGASNNTDSASTVSGTSLNPGDSEFIQFSKRGKLNFASTLGLLKLNERISESATEITILSEQLAFETMARMREHIAVLYRASEAIGVLDMLLSFATYASVTGDVCRPEFTDTLAFRHCKHPVKSKLMNDKYIANDVYMFDGSSMQVICGPNMSGKSTYLKQIAVVTLMAHIGCMLPADYASVRLFDRILCRVVNDCDEVDINVSGFTKEMKQVSHIMNMATKDSLVLLDEVGRATSPQDGVGITCAICEDLIAKECFAYVVTHFTLEVPRLMSLYPKATIIQSQINLSDDDNVFEYKYNFSKSTYGDRVLKNYGIRLARDRVGFVDSIIDEAMAVSKKYEKRLMKQTDIVSDEYFVVKRKQEVIDKLKQLQSSMHDMADDKLIECFETLRLQL